MEPNNLKNLTLQQLINRRWKKKKIYFYLCFPFTILYIYLWSLINKGIEFNILNGLKGHEELNLFTLLLFVIPLIAFWGLSAGPLTDRQALMWQLDGMKLYAKIRKDKDFLQRIKKVYSYYGFDHFPTKEIAESDLSKTIFDF
ncbi:MAG TPA: hypothetical protein VG621_02875 [Candidatus Paceibacterota bacterium]|nr:hypothetical protein [Candidatus Paceibacterota bacterium]